VRATIAAQAETIDHLHSYILGASPSLVTDR